MSRLNFAFDLERTLDAEPEAFRALTSALLAADHGVYVVTGLFPGALREHREAQLAASGFIEGTHFTSLICCPGSSPAEIGAAKGRICRDLGAALMFEDRPDFIEQISPTTRCLLMVPR